MTRDHAGRFVGATLGTALLFAIGACASDDAATTGPVTAAAPSQVPEVVPAPPGPRDDNPKMMEGAKPTEAEHKATPAPVAPEPKASPGAPIETTSETPPSGSTKTAAQAESAPVSPEPPPEEVKTAAGSARPANSGSTGTQAEKKPDELVAVKQTSSADPAQRKPESTPPIASVGLETDPKCPPISFAPARATDEAIKQLAHAAERRSGAKVCSEMLVVDERKGTVLAFRFENENITIKRGATQEPRASWTQVGELPTREADSVFISVVTLAQQIFASSDASKSATPEVAVAAVFPKGASSKVEKIPNSERIPTGPLEGRTYTSIDGSEVYWTVEKPLNVSNKQVNIIVFQPADHGQALARFFALN